MLSPPPKTPSRSVMQSPKQIDGRISLYITPMDRKCADLKESPNSVTYLIDRSPAKVSELVTTFFNKKKSFDQICSSKFNKQQNSPMLVLADDVDK